MNNSFEDKLKELKKGYINKLKDTLLLLKNILNDKNINIVDIYSRIHTISGTSGMYGLNNISEISTEFEIYLKPLKEDPDSINSKELENKFSDYINSLDKILSVGE